MIEASIDINWDAKRMERMLSGEMRKRMYQTVNLLVSESKRIVPVDTGNLRNSLTCEVDPSGLVGWYGSNRPWRGEASVEYAIYVEFGTKKMSPRPYLRPPLTTKRSEVLRLWAG
ncbi:MAG: HK97 gp10 family phage protein [Candidatus Methanosuratincola petrocarbonis]